MKKGELTRKLTLMGAFPVHFSSGISFDVVGVTRISPNLIQIGSRSDHTFTKGLLHRQSIGTLALILLIHQR